MSVASLCCRLDPLSWAPAWSPLVSLSPSSVTIGHLTLQLVGLQLVSGIIFKLLPKAILTYFLALIWVYIAGFGATWGPVSWTLISEIFPLSIRAKGASIGASSNWVNNFAIAFFVPPMLEAWEWGTYIFFAVFLFVGIIWVWFYLPETKNASLEEMDRVFKSRAGEQDAILLQEAQAEVGLLGSASGQKVSMDKGGEKHVEEL